MTLTPRPATAADIANFYPGMTASFRAWACDVDGEPQGIIGVALLRPAACMFSAFREPLRPYLGHPAVLRLIKKAEAVVKASTVPVLALAEPDMPTAPKLLERLGFRHAGEYDVGSVYEWIPGGDA